MFTLGNSTDASLLLRFSYLGVASGWLVLLWAVHNVVRMISTWFGGRWSDRLGRRRLMVGFGAGTALAAVAVAIPARVPDSRPFADSHTTQPWCRRPRRRSSSQPARSGSRRLRSESVSTAANSR